MNNEVNTKTNSEDFASLPYMQGTYKWGKIWGFILCALILAFPLVLCLVFGAVPEWGPMFRASLSVVPMYWAVGIIEIFTYVPMLGAGGAYLSFVTGNISNLKLPCALDSLEKSGYKASSEEGEIVSTISIAVSSIVTMFIIIVGVVLIVPLRPIIENPSLTPAFDNILPALFGGLAVVFISKNLKIAILPMFVMLVAFIFIPALNSSTVGIMVPVGVILTLIEARIMYKKGLLTK